MSTNIDYVPEGFTISLDLGGLEQYHGRAILDGLCYSLHRHHQFILAGAADIASEIRALLGEYQGAEVQTVQLERKSAILQRRQDQAEEVEQLLDEAKDLYRALTGDDWKVPNRTAKPQTDATDAKARAEALLAQMAAK